LEHDDKLEAAAFEQKLHGSQIAGTAIDERRLGSTECGSGQSVVSIEEI